MSRTTTVRKYGKSVRKTRAEELFAQLPKSPEVARREQKKLLQTAAPMKPKPEFELRLESEVVDLTEKLDLVKLEETETTAADEELEVRSPTRSHPTRDTTSHEQSEIPDHRVEDDIEGQEDYQAEDDRDSSFNGLQVLTWDDVCSSGDRIEKIAEASYAEVYRITNEHGTSIIKVVRLKSPIKPQTKAQERSGLVDEEPHEEEDMLGELRISEWLADIPGFVVYKDRYVVEGKAPKALLETHQAFHRRMKRKDPDRLQFYPSPSRYLADTRFLVVELGDAGTALEDFHLTSIDQVWDIFLHTALALARAEDLIEFEHRDLHEGNLCIRQVRPPTPKPPSSSSPLRFGFSGLDITILDYGLSRATLPSASSSSKATAPTSTATTEVVAYDLEKDLALFTSTHAPQCAVYRRMRSYLVSLDRHPPPPEPDSPAFAAHYATPYRPVAAHTGRPISWRDGHYPYTNVLWLAYLYGYLVEHFAAPPPPSSKDGKGTEKRGREKKEREETELRRFKRETRELWRHLDPCAPRGVLSFPSAGEVVRFAVEAGWVSEAQVCGGGEGSFLSVADGDHGTEGEGE
ncbi:hypothetical protein VTK26DRAFT_1540 [Humicola hyalothermophila]